MLHLYSRLLSFRRAGDVKQFASILQPCPTTSRPRDIPAGNIRQRQTDSSPHVSLSKSLRGCGADFSEAESNSEAATTASSVFSGKLDADLRGKWLCARQHNDIFGPSD